MTSFFVPIEIVIKILKNVNKIYPLNKQMLEYYNTNYKYGYYSKSYFPSNLKNLVVVNQIIEHTFPSILNKLYIDNVNSSGFELIIPTNLNLLYISLNLSSTLILLNHQNKTIQDISILSDTIKNIEKINIDSVKRLYIKSSSLMYTIPKNLEKLICKYNDFVLPETLDELTLYLRHDQKELNIPKKVKKLILFCIPRDINLIYDISQLEICNCYDKRYLGKNIKKLTFREGFDKEIYDLFPDNMEDLRLCNYSRNLTFPKNIMHLNLGTNFDHYINFENFKYLISLNIGNIYRHNITKLPDTLKILIVKNKNRDIINIFPESLECFVNHGSTNFICNDFMNFHKNLNSFSVDLSQNEFKYYVNYHDKLIKKFGFDFRIYPRNNRIIFVGNDIYNVYV